MVKKQTRSKVKSINRPAALAVIILLLIAGIGAAYTIHRKQTVSGTQGTAEQIRQQATEELNAKKQLVEGSKSDSSKTPNSDSSNAGQNDTGSNIQFSARTEKNSTVTVITKLTGLGSGTCKLTVTNGSASTNQSADVIYAPEYSSCAGFSVPISGLGVGNWNIALLVTSSGQEYTKTITYEVE